MSTEITAWAEKMGDAPMSPAIGQSTARRPSDTPSLVNRRNIQLPDLKLPQFPTALRRPQPRPLQSASDSEHSLQGQSSRSVRFNSLPNLLEESIPLRALSPRSVLPTHNNNTKVPSTVFGVPTNYRPLWLLGLGNLGTCLFGLGEVVVARALWPSETYQGLDENGVTFIPSGEAGTGAAFGGPTDGIIGGTILMAIGLSLALTACTCFVKDGRALNRRQNPGSPNYRRTMTYYYLHLSAVALLVGHRFAIETFRVYLAPQWTWVAAVPGAVGQAIFAVTQAQSFSSCEVYYGKMDLKYRGEIGASARAGVALYTLLAAIAGTPNFSAYGRETVRSMAQVSTAIAYSLPLTTARLNAPAPGTPVVEVGELRYRGDWTALQIYGVYALARLAAMLGSFWLARSRWPAEISAGDPAFADGPNITAWNGLPPPLPNGPADWDMTSCAAFLLVSASLLAVYAFVQFSKDSRPPPIRGQLLFAGALSSVILGEIYRSLVEDAKSHANFERIWEAFPFGFLANALAFVVIPELFSESESTRGNCRIPYRYQVTEACRAGGNLCYTLWASMSGILGFPPLARMMMAYAGSMFSILGMALPDASTRKNQTGSLGTPQGEPSDWLSAHTTSR